MPAAEPLPGPGRVAAGEAQFGLDERQCAAQRSAHPAGDGLVAGRLDPVVPLGEVALRGQYPRLRDEPGDQHGGIGVGVVLRLFQE